MRPIRYYSTNNPAECVDFRAALMNGLASNYGLYMLAKENIPRLPPSSIKRMRETSYAEIAFETLYPFVWEVIEEKELFDLLADAYHDDVVPTLEHVTGKTSILWLTKGPTHSFKDYAALFYGRMLNYFLQQSALRRVVVVATSGDTGGAVAHALYGLERIDNIVFFPKGMVSEGQRRQMTTLKGNVYAFEVNGDFDVCQALVKRLLADKGFPRDHFKDPDRFTSANSISIGRLLPQAIYPFFAYSRLAEYGEPIIFSVPSGNFGNMMGTLLARQMGLPVSNIVCAVNENREFPEFLRTGEYLVKPTIKSPSTAMVVSNPSNFARLVDFYGGHVYDKYDENGTIVGKGIMDKKPDMKSMRRDLYSMGVSNPDHYRAMAELYERYGILIEPHGAVAWRVLNTFLQGNHDRLAVVYETADPGKFPEDVQKAIGVTPTAPKHMAEQAGKEDRVYSIDDAPDANVDGSIGLSQAQYGRAKEIIMDIIPY